MLWVLWSKKLDLESIYSVSLNSTTNEFSTTLKPKQTKFFQSNTHICICIHRMASTWPDAHTQHIFWPLVSAQINNGLLTCDPCMWTVIIIYIQYIITIYNSYTVHSSHYDYLRLLYVSRDVIPFSFEKTKQKEQIHGLHYFYYTPNRPAIRNLVPASIHFSH